jgi:glucose/mannose-6-phosphate isomerase
LLDISKIKKIDKNAMYQVYDDWPKIAELSYKKNYECINKTKIDHIIFSGMGGSGTIGDVFNAILSKTDIHVSVVKGYLLPNTVNEKTIVITTSVSGNTIETLAVLKSAYEKKCRILAFSSGGKMEEFCKNNKIEFRKIEKFHSPRGSFTSFLYSMLKILQPIIPISDDSIIESINELKNVQKKICSKNLTKENPSLSLAEWINDIPLIYYPNGLQSAAIRFKNSLQENSKNHAMIEDVVEASHNGIVSWEKESKIQPILLKGEDDYIKTKERWSIIEEFFKMKDIDCKIISSTKGNILTKIMNLIYILDYATIYKSILLNIDPSPIFPIEFVKDRIVDEEY